VNTQQEGDNEVNNNNNNNNNNNKTRKCFIVYTFFSI